MMVLWGKTERGSSDMTLLKIGWKRRCLRQITEQVVDKVEDLVSCCSSMREGWQREEKAD